MIDPIEYELDLPATQTGERLAKTIGRILKHTYEATRVRIEQSKEAVTVTAKVSRLNLNAIRGAVRMTCMAKGVTAELHRDASTLKGDAQGERDCGAPSREVIQAQPQSASDDASTAS